MSSAGMTIFSGGTACNALVPILDKLTSESPEVGVTYVLGVSDNGGSTSEILRVLGGPAIGDIRSRLTRLIPTDANQVGFEVDSGGQGESTAASDEQVAPDGRTGTEIRGNVDGAQAEESASPSTNEEQKEALETNNLAIPPCATKRKNSLQGCALSPSHSTPSVRAQRLAMFDLLSYRLPASGTFSEPKAEWIDIVEGTHKLWLNISSERKEVIRGFLVLFHTEVLRRAHKRFDFRNASVGNCFLTGARIFFGSLESAIFQFSAITGIEESTQVVPVINTNHSVNIAAKLTDGNVILGQCQISHPSKPLFDPTDPSGTIRAQRAAFGEIKITGKSNIIFDKSDAANDLTHRIERIYYINEYGKEILPRPNPKILSSFLKNNTLIYSIGSLYTSIHPCLILQGIGSAIAQSPSLKFKILLLNSFNDRETPLYTAMDFIKSIVDALNSSLRPGGVQWPLEYSASHYITHLVYLKNSEVSVDVWQVEKLGIHCVPINGSKGRKGRPCHREDELYRALRKIIYEGG